MNRHPPLRIETARLVLRRPESADLEALFDIHGDPETNRFNPSGPMPSRQKAVEVLEAWLAHWEGAGFGYWSVCKRDDAAQVIGFGGVMNKTIDGREGLNLYFRFRPSAWGSGYANEMAQAALDFTFNTLEREPVWGLVRPSNLPSRKALERLGMVLARTVDDVAGQEPSLLYELDRARFSKPSGG
ncbi:MAG TPA: GNAT family N-acetyltransferase [Paucimonas sp.]|nr:GNAT family N-acetyltransferase [Paucimonas sp.]